MSDRYLAWVKDIDYRGNSPRHEVIAAAETAGEILFCGYQFALDDEFDYERHGRFILVPTGECK